jgi:hypothetical protein
VRLYFQQQSDDLTMASATYRWWSNPTSFVLAPTDGVVTLSVPLRGGQWTNVGGMTGVQQPDGFAAALAHPANVGMTFGGGCFFGHGVLSTAAQRLLRSQDFRLARKNELRGAPPALPSWSATPAKRVSY